MVINWYRITAMYEEKKPSCVDYPVLAAFDRHLCRKSVSQHRNLDFLTPSLWCITHHNTLNFLSTIMLGCITNHNTLNFLSTILLWCIINHNTLSSLSNIMLWCSTLYMGYKAAPTCRNVYRICTLYSNCCKRRVKQYIFLLMVLFKSN